MLQGCEATGRAAFGRGAFRVWGVCPGGNVESPQVPASAFDLGKASGPPIGGRGARGVGLGRPGERAQSPQVAASRAVDLGPGGGRR